MPSAITPRHPAMRELCDVLGLRHVTRLELSAAVGEAVTVTVERLLIDDEADELLRIVKEHKLVVDDGVEVFVPEPTESGDDVTTVDDDSRKYKP